MTAGLACSAGDLARHLPPGAPRSKNNRIFFTSPLRAVGCGLAAAQKNPSVTCVGALAHVAEVETLHARISFIKRSETIRFV